jgi:hypothetical protein
MVLMFVSGFFDDARRCGAGDPEQQKHGNKVSHREFPSMI